MKIINTNIQGLYTTEIEKRIDERGFFARIWDKKLLKEYGLNTEVAQSSISYNNKKGTLRGLHYQLEPHSEVKYVRVIKGSAFYVAVDVRPDSPTFKKYYGVKLSSDNLKGFYISKGFASGFITLEDNTELYYQISQKYVEEASKGLRWDDPAFGIKWPLRPKIISKNDLNFSFFNNI